MASLTAARRITMKTLAAKCADLAKRGDHVLAEQAARGWLDLATLAEARRAPAYIRRYVEARIAYWLAAVAESA